MSHTYSDIVDGIAVTISVNSDWSGFARVAVEDKRTSGYGQAVCDAREMSRGMLVNLAYEAGAISTDEWLIVVAFAARTRLAAQVRSMVEDL